MTRPPAATAASETVAATRFGRLDSLRYRIILWTGCVITLVFTLVIAYTTINFRDRLQQAIYHELGTENQGYIHAISAVFREKATLILAQRDDLELYETRGQMWVHIAAHTGEIVFDDPKRGAFYQKSFRRKLDAYLASEQLGGAHRTPQVDKLLQQIETRHNAFGEGMKYFYIGVPSSNPDPVLRGYDEYQDSSLWVPDPRVDAPYDPTVRPWYLAGMRATRDSVVFTEPYPERRTGEALVSGGTRIMVEGSEGVFAGGISIKPIMDSLLRSFREKAHITIFSRGGEAVPGSAPSPPKYVYSSRDATLGDQGRAVDDAEVVQTPANRDVLRLYEATRGQDSGVVRWTIGGDVRLVAYDTVPGIGWKLYSSVPREHVMAEAVAALYRNIAISVAGLVVLLWIIAWVVKRALRPLRTIGRELNAIAQTGDLSRRTSVRSRDEVGQMARAINAMLDNTAGPVRELAMRVQRIAAGDLQADVHVDAKGDIAQLVNSFNDMTRRLIEFEATHRDASPLTGLPGGVTIESAVQQRIDQGIAFVFCMFDLDNFKPFNDRYGYSRGNLVLKMLASLLQQAVDEHGAPGDFVGHIGGDDFVVLSTPEQFRVICEQVLARFDAAIPHFYDEEDRSAAQIMSTDRRGLLARFPIMTLTVCAVDSRSSNADSYIRVGEIAAELKATGKQMGGSNLVLDRRRHG